MTLRHGLDGHDARAPMLVKPVKALVGLGDERGKRGAGNGNLAMPARRSDENKPASNFNIRRLLGEKALSNVHSTPLPLLNTTEQLGIGSQSRLTSNGDNGLIDGPIYNLRQAAVRPFRKGTALIIGFARWYWGRVREFPLVFAAFTAGCVVEAVFITVPSLAHQVLARL